MTKIHYLAYGSNLHPVRLQKRVPSARPNGVVQLPGYRLEFSKRSQDGSGKCTIAESAGNAVFTALYSMNKDEQRALDRVEGLGFGYERKNLQLPLEGKTIDAFTYIAAKPYIDPGLIPYRWYKDLVVEGARYHTFPAEYMAFLDGFESLHDPNPERRSENETLLAEMKCSGPGKPTD